MLLKLENGAKFYAGKLVFKGIGLELSAGETLIAAGPNGAGKSTLLKILAGVSRLDAGRLVRAVGPEKTGYLGHQTFIYPQLSALENLRFWAGIHGLSPSRAELDKALDRVELGRAAMERAGTFSRGMAQRLNLARVFMSEPELLLLDEPGTGLDARSSAILKNEITAAAGRGAGLVWVSHHLERDLESADKVLCVMNRKCGYYGPASEFSPEMAMEAAR